MYVCVSVCVCACVCLPEVQLYRIHNRRVLCMRTFVRVCARLCSSVHVCVYMQMHVSLVIVRV